MRLAVVAKSAWKDLPQRVDALAKSLSSKLPTKVEIALILKDYGDIPADKNGRIMAAFLDKTLAVGSQYAGACLLVSLADRKKYKLKSTLRGHYHRDEDGYAEFWVASDRTTKRKGKPQFEETFSHELCHALYHQLGAEDRTHYWHNDVGSLDGAFKEISAAWPKPKKPDPTAKPSKLDGLDKTLAIGARRTLSAMKELHEGGQVTRRAFAYEGCRSDETQAEYYAQGRTKPSTVPCVHGGVPRKVGTCQTHPLGATVTNAKPGQSLHNSCRAVDIVFEDPTGKGKFWDAPDRDWEILGMMGKSYGLKWGGDWKGFPDLPHFEL